MIRIESKEEIFLAQMANFPRLLSARIMLAEDNQSVGQVRCSYSLQIFLALCRPGMDLYKFMAIEQISGGIVICQREDGE